MTLQQKAEVVGEPFAGWFEPHARSFHARECQETFSSISVLLTEHSFEQVLF